MDSHALSYSCHDSAPAPGSALAEAVITVSPRYEQVERFCCKLYSVFRTLHRTSTLL
jgi:hypothetical protein